MRRTRVFSATGGAALLTLGLLTPAAASETSEPQASSSASIPAQSSTAEGDGWFEFGQRIPSRQHLQNSSLNGQVGIFGAYDHWFSGEFKASVAGAKWGHAGGAVSMRLTVTNCTPGYPSIKVRLIRTVAGAMTNYWDKTVACGGPTTYSWGNHDAGTYNLYFSRSGPADHDENTKRVEGWVTYNV